MAELINRLKIFISWHNDAINNSKLVAREFKLFIKALFELDLDVFYSGDMESGKWRVNLDNGFVDCSYAVFILQGDAVNANWINAEYGAFVMKSLLCNDDACSKLIAFRFPDDKEIVSKSKAPIKDLQVYELSPNPEQGVLSYFGRMLYELKNDVSAKKLSDDDYIKLLKEEKGGVFSRYWDVVIKNIVLLKQYGQDYKREEYVLNNVIFPANISTSTSIDDIDFNKIAFCYTKPDNKEFFGRELFVNKLHDCFESGKNCLNVVATGGMGKTSVAHIYIKKFRSEYDKVHFVTSNHDICDDFNEDLRKCITNIVPSYGALLKPRQEGDKNDFLGQVDHILAKATKKCLLVVDVNVDEEGLSALKLNESKTKWHIFYLSRKKIKGTLNDGFELPSFENDFDGAKGLFNSIYPNDWNKDRLDNLFKKVYYHPLLLEHLAAYGIKGSEKKDYNTLSKVVAESRIKNLSLNKRYSYHSTCFIDKEKTIDICVYLSQLFVFDHYTEEEKWVMQHFILWPYDFISVTTIISLLKNDNIPDLEGVLLDLVDKVVFSKSSQGYRMHGLLAETLREKNLNYDYTVYVNNIKKLLYYPNRNNEFEKCFYNVDIVYNQWLEKQPNNPLPKELLNNKGCRVVTILVKGVKFDMVRVNDYYMGETQVTQELWMAVMGDNPSLFSDKKTTEYPVENVSWYDCLAFVMRLNEITGLKFSLPTENQWECAAGWKKKGGHHIYGGCDTGYDLYRYAWFTSNSKNRTHRVRSLDPNELGLYDMSGNVWEWCQNLYDSSGSSRVLRGGSWYSNASNCSVSKRRGSGPSGRGYDCGMRLALSCLPSPS